MVKQQMSNATHVLFHANLGYNTNKVKAIKAIRAISLSGLKEAKELSEQAEKDFISITIDHGATIHELTIAYNSLGECGKVELGGTGFEKYVTELREMAMAATLAGDYYVARAIILMLEEKFG